MMRFGAEVMMQNQEQKYTDFLRQKIRMANFAGFDLQPQDVNPILFPHQRDIVRWAVRGGGSELNPGYFMDQVHYLRAAERQVSMPTLFDLEAMDADQPVQAEA